MGMIFNQIPMLGYANAAEIAKDLKISATAKDQFAVPDWATPPIGQRQWLHGLWLIKM